MKWLARLLRSTSQMDYLKVVWKTSDINIARGTTDPCYRVGNKSYPLKKDVLVLVHFCRKVMIFVSFWVIFVIIFIKIAIITIIIIIAIIINIMLIQAMPESKPLFSKDTFPTMIKQCQRQGELKINCVTRVV